MEQEILYDYAGGLKFEVIPRVSEAIKTFNSFSGLTFKERLHTKWPHIPSYYTAYGRVYKFTVHLPEGVKIFLWDGFWGEFRVRVGYPELPLDLLAQGLLEDHPTSDLVVVDYIEVKSDEETRKVVEGFFGWREFAYHTCVGDAEGLLVKVTFFDELQKPKKPIPLEEIHTFMGERISGYDVVHELLREEYQELTLAMWGKEPALKPHKLWEDFLTRASKDPMIVLDGHGADE